MCTRKVPIVITAYIYFILSATYVTIAIFSAQE